MLIYASSCPGYFAEHGEAFVRSAKRHGYAVKVDLTGPNDYDEPRFYPAAFRFLNLPELLDQTDRVLVLDIDSIINGPIDINDEWDMALFFRPWLPDENKKVMFSASYWTKRALPFAVRMRELFTPQYKWCDDQKFAWRTFVEMGNRFNIGKLDQNFISYDFRADAPIWTAKGPTRKANPVYLERRAAYA